MFSAQQTAEMATFQSFANCYLREVNPGGAVTHRHGSGRTVDCIEWTLASQRLIVRAEVTSRSLCGPLHFGTIWTRPAADSQWRSVEPMSALPSLIQDAGLVPETDTIEDLYFPEADIHDRFAYYAVVNQIFSVIARMGHDGIAEETVLLALLHRRLEALARDLTGAGRRFADSLIHSPTIAAKANLRARLFGVDELQALDTRSLYRRITNPLRAWQTASTERLGHAIAS